MSASDRMRGRALVLALALAVPAPAWAQDLLDAEAFEAQVTGYTITFQQFGRHFGTEQYLPGRQVRWRAAENLCQHGTWFPQGEAICFVYDHDPTPHCWHFWLDGGALVARSVLDQPGAELHAAERSTEPLACPGPDLGV